MDEVNSGVLRLVPRSELLIRRIISLQAARPPQLHHWWWLFTKFQQLPVSIAWEAFGAGNGVSSLFEFGQRIVAIATSRFTLTMTRPSAHNVAEPFFWPDNLWISSPLHFKAPTVQGKGYDAEVGTGRELWNEVEQRLKLPLTGQLSDKIARTRR